MSDEDVWMEDFLEEYAGTKRYADTPNRPGKRPKGYKKNPVSRLLKSKRTRLTPVTRSLKKKGGTRTSRAWEISPQRLRYPSSSKSRSRSVSRTPSLRSQSDASMKSSASGKKVSFVFDANPSKVRHKLTRKNARKTMPRGGKPYARRKTMRKPRGAYRGAIMPKWAKGETKHQLCHDGMASGSTNAPNCQTCGTLTKSNLESAKVHDGETVLGLGSLKAWCMNPVAQGTEEYARNGRSVDGTYLRIQGHLRNKAASAKAYVRMLVLAVKGGQSDGKAKLSATTLFKKIDGSVVGYLTPASGDAGYSNSGAARVRTLQLPVNKSLYTVLSDQKMQLAGTNESFGSSDRLFDLKMKLKQRTKFFDGDAASFENNQLVFVVMVVDPTCADAPGGTSGTTEGINLEFESKYSFKDF